MEEAGKRRILRSFFDFLGCFFLRPSMAVVEGRGVALTLGVELPGVGPPGAGVSAQALAP